MPVIKSAKKKLRKDKIRTKKNKAVLDLVKKSVKNAQKIKSEKAIRDAVIAIDKSVKNKLIHKNKAARIKSRLSKLIKSKTQKTEKSTKKSSPKPKAK